MTGYSWSQLKRLLNNFFERAYHVYGEQVENTISKTGQTHRNFEHLIALFRLLPALYAQDPRNHKSWLKLDSAHEERKVGSYVCKYTFRCVYPDL